MRGKCKGCYDIANNFAKKTLRSFAVGRRNGFFMCNKGGGEASANFFSLIESAKANGLNPYAYFSYVDGTVANSFNR